jgi:hypothetical protein
MKFVNLVQLKFCLLLSLLVVCIAANANEIDELKTDKQVLSFIKKLSPKDERIGETRFYARYSHDKKTQKTADSLGVKNWVKIDFDKNGETDLIAFNLHDLRQIVAIFSINGNYKKINSTWSVGYKYSLTYPIIKNIDGKNLILIYHNQRTSNRIKLGEDLNYTPVECDTIHYEKGMFLNYYKNLEKHKVESIEIMGEDNDLGTTVKVKIDFINLNDSCLESRYNSSIYPLKEKFTYKLTQSEILKIKYLLELSNLSALNNNVRFGIEHHYDYQVEIVYDNGKVKKVEDSGGVVNYNFAEIYNMIYNFTWVKSQ